MSWRSAEATWLRRPGERTGSKGAALLAASVLSATPFTPPALAAVPTATELSRISEGLARIDYLLDNWDKLTTVCKGTPDELEAKQTVKIVDGLGGTRCSKSPLIVQKFIGAASTLDPLFKAEKVMIRAVPLVDSEKADAYNDAVDEYITKQQMSPTVVRGHVLTLTLTLAQPCGT